MLFWAVVRSLRAIGDCSGVIWGRPRGRGGIVPSLQYGGEASYRYVNTTSLRSCCLDDPGIVACGKITVLRIVVSKSPSARKVSGCRQGKPTDAPTVPFAYTD